MERSFNKAIFVLLILALGVTTLSLFIGISKLSAINHEFNLITGAATNWTTGTTTLTVSSQTQLTTQVASIAFGSGYVDARCTNCTMDSDLGLGGNGSLFLGAYGNYGNGSCCASFNNQTSGIILENTGNQNLSLNMTCSMGACNATDFIGGATPVPLFMFKVSPAYNRTNRTAALPGDSVTDTANSCRIAGVGMNYTDNYTSLRGNVSYRICGNQDEGLFYFDSTGTSDALVLDIYVRIPYDAPATGTQESATFNFSASSGG